MLYTTIKRRGTALNCEVLVVENSIVLKNFYQHAKEDNYVRYAPKVPLSYEQFTDFLTKLVENVKKEGLLIPNDYRFDIEKFS